MATTIASYLQSHPKASALYEAVREMIEKIGPVEMEAMKTQISFGNNRKFAWVWLPQMWTKNRSPDSITLTFDLDRQVKDRRIAETVPTRPGHWTHHVVIDAKKDLDATIRGWLAEAYAFGLRGRKRKQK